MNIRPDQLKVSLKRMIMVRLLIVTFFLFVGMVAIDAGELLFGMIVAIGILSLLYIVWLAAGRLLLIQAWTQIVVDLILETVLIYHTNGYDSVFTTLMVLTIISASLVLVPYGGIFASLAGSAMFASVVIYLQWLSPTNTMLVSYVTYVKICILISVGLLSSFLSRRIFNLERQIRLHESLTYLGEMAAHLAHEIRNPLMSITGSIELLNRELAPSLSVQQKHLMNTVSVEGSRLTQMLSQVLSYTRDESLKLEPVSVNELLDEVFLMLEHSHEVNGKVKMNKRYKTSTMQVTVDRARMKQVILNILLNGIQAMPEGGTLDVSVLHQQDKIRIYFQDSGCGMSRDQIKDLFIPFKTTKVEGTGVGLAIAQKIVRQHGGSILVDSKEKVGSTFQITLPAS